MFSIFQSYNIINYRVDILKTMNQTEQEFYYIAVVTYGHGLSKISPSYKDHSAFNQS